MKYTNIEIDILLKDIDYRREEIMYFTRKFNDNSKIINTFSVILGVLLSAVIFHRPYDFANHLLIEFNVGVDTYSIIVLIGATIFLYYLISERLSLLCHIYLNGSRIKHIERIINANFDKELIIWESKIIENYYFYNFSKSKLWVNPTYLLGISYGIIVLYISCVLILLAYRILIPSWFVFYASSIGLLTMFFFIQTIEVNRTGKRYLDSLFENSSDLVYMNRNTFSFFNLIWLINRKYLVSIITFIAGFFMFFVFSLFSDSFFLSSKVDFPLLVFPTILLGDSVILPVINYRIFRSLKLLKGKMCLQIYIIIVISFLISCVGNIFIHLLWVNDNYFGFMDFIYGQLSFAGFIHLIFSIVQTNIIVFFSTMLVVFPDLFDHDYRYNVFTLFLFVIFCSLSICDFLVQSYHLDIALNTLSIFDIITRFYTLLFSVVFFIWMHFRLRKRNSFRDVV